MEEGEAERESEERRMEEGGGEGEEEVEEMVPVDVVESLARLEKELSEVETHVRTLLQTCTRDTLSILSPLERASTFIALSKTLNTLFCLYLRSKGESLDDHPANSEVDRVSLYESKVEHLIDIKKAPLRPTSSVNIQAANRFIEHAIPDLTEEQRRAILEVGMTTGGRLGQRSNGLKRGGLPSGKSQDPGRVQSLTEAAAAFLAEARKELLATQSKEKQASEEGDIE